jgi:hypothetical protein
LISPRVKQHEAITFPYGKPEARFRSGDGKPVVAIDIDGTLGNYHAHFLWFAERWLGIPMPSEYDINPGLRLSEFMNVPHSVYRECKLAYRQGGLKRFMPVYTYAAELTHNIRATGAEVWICTTRPYLRLDNIDPDTREWLRRNDIKYDAVIFQGISYEDGTHQTTKYEDLVRQVGVNRIVAAIDDLPEQTEDAFKQGIRRVYLRDQPYNRSDAVRGIRIMNLSALWFEIQKDIQDWKENNEL